MTGTTVEELVFTPVAGAQVTVGGVTVTSGADGAFTASGVPVGEQTLTVGADGYIPFTTTVQVTTGTSDVGQLWLRRAQADAGAADAGADGPRPDGAPEDGGQTDAAQTDAVPTDVMQTDATQTDVIQTDVVQRDAQTDLGQQDGPVSLACGTLALTALEVTPGTPVNDVTFTGVSQTAPHPTTPCTLGAAGPEKVYFYDLDHVADLVWEVTPNSAWNVVAYVRQDCDGLDGATQLADPVCADVGATSAAEKAIWLAAQPGRYFFFVDGETATDVGSYWAQLTVREIHGVSGACDGVTARCQDGLYCGLGTCWTVAGWCDGHPTGTLQAGVQATGDTTSTGDNLQCLYGGIQRGLGNDQFWLFTADATGGLYNVHATSTDHDLFIYNTSDCTNWLVTTNCTESTTTPRDVNFDVNLAANGKTYVVVDGFSGYVGTYTVEVDKVVYVGASATCDGRVRRCTGGLTCWSGTCQSTAAICGPLSKGTLTPGTPAFGDTTAATNRLTCGAVVSDTDDLWTITAATAGTYAVLVWSNDHDVFAYSTSDCTSSAASAGCTPGDERQAHFDVALQAGETAYAVVDGLSGQHGTYGLLYDKVQPRNLNDPCDPTNPLFDRCVAGTYCDPTSHCTAVMTEVEVNDSAAQANAATSGRPIAGAISSTTDIDWFAVTATAGDLIVAETSDGATSRCANKGLDSRLTIYQPGGTVEIAQNDDIDYAAGNWCSFVAARATQTGTHYVALDLVTNIFDYTLRIWVITPTYLAESESNDTAGTADALAGASVVAGNLNPSAATPDVIDYFVVPVTRAHRLFARTANGTTSQCGTSLPSVVQILGADGTTVLDTSPAACSFAHAAPALATGNEYVAVSLTSLALTDYSLEVFILPE